MRLILYRNFLITFGTTDKFRSQRAKLIRLPIVYYIYYHRQTLLV